ncbi:MAG: pyruvate kinase, partial [Firmicutes bacterium]|nr:pyruvate kinase [Bacillota bacterium]
KFAIDNDFDIIAASFVRSKDDLGDLLRLLSERNNPNILIISKIENREGIDNIDEILALSDGIMVARGDLGVEIDFEEIPAVQKFLIKKALLAGKHCITATQMLESMIKNPRPTRAEITDVANSIYDGTSAIMLSGETAVGKHPVDTVRTMVSIARYTERDIDYCKRFGEFAFDKAYKNVSDAVCMSAVSLAHNIGAQAIVASSVGGKTTNMVAHFRPCCKILGFTSNEKVFNQMALTWGVTPYCLQVYVSAAELFRDCFAVAKADGTLKKGDTIVTTAGIPLGVSGQTNNVRAMKVE